MMSEPGPVDAEAVPTRAPAAGPDCLLTLSVPPAVEDEVVDVLLGEARRATGFTLWPGAGMGTSIALAPGRERVQGRARRVFIQIAMRQAEVDGLLQAIGRSLSGAGIVWWTVPLSGFGRVEPQR